MKMNKLNTKAAFLLLVMFFLTSCSDKPSKTIKPGERAVARWEALIERNWEKAYSFETPGYKKAYKLSKFKKQFGFMLSWKSAKHLTTQLNKEKTIATVKLEIISLFEPDGGGDMLIPNVISEKWLLKDRQWWHITEDTSLSK